MDAIRIIQNKFVLFGVFVLFLISVSFPELTSSGLGCSSNSQLSRYIDYYQQKNAILFVQKKLILFTVLSLSFVSVSFPELTFGTSISFYNTQLSRYVDYYQQINATLIIQNKFVRFAVWLLSFVSVSFPKLRTTTQYITFDDNVQLSRYIDYYQ